MFCLSSSCVPCVASFSGLFINIAASVFSNVYLSSIDVHRPFGNFVHIQIFSKTVHPYRTKISMDGCTKEEFQMKLILHGPIGLGILLTKNLYC